MKRHTRQDQIKACASLKKSLELQKTKIMFYASLNSSQPPWATAGHLPLLSAPGVGHLQSLRCPEDGHLPTPGPFLSFDTHAVSYQNMTTQRILLEKKGDWLICQGQEKIEEGCKGMFLILCMHFFIAYNLRSGDFFSFYWRKKIA